MYCWMQNIWPYTVLPTMLYTWQYYDLVDKVANPGRSCYAFWVRTCFVATAGFGTVIATNLASLSNAAYLWYVQPFHFDKSKAFHYTLLMAKYNRLSFWFLVSVCLLSIGLLGGTIYWVRSLTLKQGQTRI
jgi:hypothetical protein